MCDVGGGRCPHDPPPRGGGDGKKGGPLRVAFSGIYVLLKNVEPLLRFKQGVFGDLK